ncbi:topoisomerase I binding, arginine/serine-rich a isoform X2 [Conger conger]|nr:topoisomerase I binding, arginine/serine-rich a isoform X2 [Conger conger]XP_061100969.1 topoisomerase I binding, arginine/serine-rich a isoform X2 [Conger conger]
MEPTKMRLRTRKKAGSDKALQAMTAEASPDSKCPICLDRFNNMAYLDRCLHKFCFRCIHEWSKNKAECPLCKQGFNSIFHTIKAENDFKEFVLRPVENGSFGSPGGHRFRYRTTLTRERRDARQITSTPPDNGVIFEGLAAAVPPQADRGVRRMMTRLAARRRAQSEGRTLRALREQEVIRFRRALYRTGVRVRSVRDGGRFRDTSAEFYQRNPACLHRLIPWLKRELTVLYGAHGSLVNIVQHIIMSWITRYDMEDQAMQEELRPFLLARTDHFLHEFISFARSPFNMEAYDQHAVYDCPAPSSLEDSSSDASVIAISEDEDELDLRRGPGAGGELGQAPWDDETPGPSYSTAEQATPMPLADSESESESGAEERAGPGAGPLQDPQGPVDPAAGKDGADSTGEEDCVIVGYVKPMVERTPELVQLSSDTEESVRDNSPEAFPQPQHIRFQSLSPPSSTASKPKSPTQRRARSRERTEAKDGDRTSVAPDGRRPSSPWGSPPPDRRGTSRETDSKSDKHHRKDKCDRDKRHRKRDVSRRRRKSRSRERRALDGTRRWSRSPTISIRSDSTLSRGVGRSRSRSRDRRPSRDGAREERRGRDGSGSGRGREKRSRSRCRDSHRGHTRERDLGHAPYGQSRSHYPSDPKNPDRWRQSRSRSRTPPGPRRRDRRRSRSRSSASSRSAHRSSRHDKPGGKRKYKTRHLEDVPRDRSHEPCAPSSPSPSSRAKEKRPGGEKHHSRSQGNSRSPSVEIVYEGRASGESRRRHKKKKKHKKKSRRRKTQEPSVITIDSDSEAAPLDLRCPESSDEASATPGNPGNTQLLEAVLQTWEGPTRPASQESSVEVLKDGAAFTADNAKHDVPIGICERTRTSPKDETSSTSKISTESNLLSCL